MRRRRILLASGVGAAALGSGLRGVLRAQQPPAAITSEAERPVAAQGLQIGDVTPAGALIWSRADRPARMMVEVAATGRFRDARLFPGPHALEPTDFTARLELADLPAGEELFVRVTFQGLGARRAVGEPVVGRFRTAPRGRPAGRRPRDVSFLWSGDTVGQGFGINPEWGGLRIYETMRREGPDFFIHSGDTIYADGPIPSELALPDGTVWKNLTTEAKSKVAETLAEFRGNYLYNLLDENLRRFNAEVPQIWQWDDHEVLNNWSSAKEIADDRRYAEKSVVLLAARAGRAFREYAPLRPAGAQDPERVYRHVPYGPLLDVFVVDMRSYRGPNTHNRQEAEGGETALLGRPQIAWLARGLAASRATWKVIAADMPLGLAVADGKDAEGRARFEAIANGDGGPPLGRELELAGLLREIARRRIRNVVWLCADVHYTAAHHYDPARARVGDFLPFWEFVSGPLHAGSFGPAKLDETFGPRVVFQKFPEKGGVGPAAGLQFYGRVRIDGQTREMTVALKDLAGATLFEQRLRPASLG